jgi:cytochrome c-type biogenesis protein CcsB
MTGLFNTAFAAYLAALVIATIALFARYRSLQVVTVSLLTAGVLLQTVYIALRWVEAGRPPFSNMFESLVLFAWTIAAVCLAVLAGTRLRIIPAASAFVVVLVLAYASSMEARIRPLMPALKSNWLSIHVSTCFLGYGGFTVSFLAAVSYLVATRRGSRILPETRIALETVVSETISFGFLLLTIGIITGSVWADAAWGSYWSWDPKETWSLITWIVYAGFLHCRLVSGWRGRVTAWVSIAGFASVLFTYFGVSYLLAGLHSYA